MCLRRQSMQDAVSQPYPAYPVAMRFLLRLVVNAAAVFLAANLVPGIAVTGFGVALLAGLILGLVNAVIKPILIVLTLPFTIVTLGLFIFVVNAICLALVAWLVPGLTISGFWAALFGAIVISLVSWLLNAIVSDDERR
jgi:putative membrane protein